MLFSRCHLNPRLIIVWKEESKASNDVNNGTGIRWVSAIIVGYGISAGCGVSDSGDCRVTSLFGKPTGATARPYLEHLTGQLPNQSIWNININTTHCSVLHHMRVQV